MSAVDEYRKEKAYLAEVCAAGTLEDLADAAVAELEAMLRLKWEDLRMLHVAGESYNDWVDDLRDRVGKGWKA